MKKKFKINDFVYSKKLQITSRITAVREYGAYIKVDAGTISCKWEDLIKATKEQIRDYLVYQSKQKKIDNIDTKFQPYVGGKPGQTPKSHPVKPKAEHIKMLKEILTFLNLKYPMNIKLPKRRDMKYPISATWHAPGSFTKMVPLGNTGVKSQKFKYGYGWTLVMEWMWLEDDSKLKAYIKAIQAKYKPKGLEFDCVLFTHSKCVYNGLISIKPIKK